MGSTLLLWRLRLVLLFSALAAGGGADIASDRAALLAFRDAVGRGALGWNSTQSPCTWQGVECLGNRVVAIRLPGVGLIGEIPSGTVGNLTALRILSLRFNGLSGRLPEDLAGVAELRNLYLQDNRFSGEITPGLFSLQKLVRLNLAGNGFTGGISPEFNNLTRLGTLYLERNGLAGGMPDLDLPKLVQFNVSYNQLNGSLPSMLRKWPASAFMGLSLCGSPLPPCPGEISPVPTPAAAGPSGKNTNGDGKIATGGSSGENGGSSGSKLSGGAIAGIAIGSAIVVLILLVLLVFLCRRSGGGKAQAVEVAAVAPKPEAAAAGGRERVEAAAGGSAASAVAVVAGDKKPEDGKQLVFFGRSGLGEFDLEDLLRASAEVLGKGSCGTTYKAVLEMGAAVVVKRLRDVNLPEQEFREKIEALGSMNHDNLLPLIAYYYSKDEKLLVYEYMPMGSLSALLHGRRGTGSKPLSWNNRVSIALGVAHAIQYIHSLRPTTSHGNIKSSNVVLTKSLDARVLDHGLSTIVGPTISPGHLAGHQAPELTNLRRASPKADVYSLGFLLLELLTGKNEEGIDLPRWVRSVVREDWLSEVFDPELLGWDVEEEMVRLLQLAMHCTAQHPDERPSMAEVEAQLEQIGLQHERKEGDDADGQSSHQTDATEHSKSDEPDS
ncbi:hypothetical protein HPP92_024809 [Vanilla planifolia]|uniref:Protein kinase domain-containing protein n=1 Tax=Vanilla planifolia TaxID=51239 RepID=A0A835PSU7_VANPL|nr:hypothetical protein HPP92_024809 [Vanilla planifolia]